MGVMGVPGGVVEIPLMRVELGYPSDLFLFLFHISFSFLRAAGWEQENIWLSEYKRWFARAPPFPFFLVLGSFPPVVGFGAVGWDLGFVSPVGCSLTPFLIS